MTLESVPVPRWKEGFRIPLLLRHWKLQWKRDRRPSSEPESTIMDDAAPMAHVVEAGAFSPLFRAMAKPTADLNDKLAHTSTHESELQTTQTLWRLG